MQPQPCHQDPSGHRNPSHKNQSGHKNPIPTVDIIIETPGGIVLIQRRNPPHGWAIPGGFVDYGESLETAAAREAMEETGLRVTIVEQFHAYSAPDRDPRQHTITTVFIATADGAPSAGDDAAGLALFNPQDPPRPMAFDHGRILADFVRYRKGAGRAEIFYGSPDHGP